MGELIEAQKRRQKEHDYASAYLGLLALNGSLCAQYGNDHLITRYVRQLMAQLMLACELDLGYKPDLQKYRGC